MRMPDRPSSNHRLSFSSIDASIAQRKCTACEEEKLQRKESGSTAGKPATAPPVVHEVLRSPGQPLDPATRAFMEPRFGRDFRQVRVHSDTAAERSARDVDAHAYTVGHNMVFGAGQFAPGTHEGRRLLAHELTHVVQQSGADGMDAGQSDEKRSLSPIFPLLSLKAGLGNCQITRRAQTLSRKPSAQLVGPPPLVNAVERATPENLPLAKLIDALDQLHLSDSELDKQRKEAAFGAIRLVGDEQKASLLKLEAIEFLAKRRRLFFLEPDWSYSQRGFRTPPPIRRLNVRIQIERGIRETGSFKKGLDTFLHTPEIESDIEFFKAEADRFATEFKSQAQLNANRLLDDSLIAINGVLRSYGLSSDSARLAAERLYRGSDVNTEAERVVKVSANSEDIDAPDRVRHRYRLAQWVKYLKKRQQTIAEWFKREDKAIEQKDWDAAKKATAELEVARNELKVGWIKAERSHPILAAYRHGRELDKLEKIDLGTLDTDPVERQLEAVLAQLLPKMVNIGKARQRVKYKKNFALTLPSVVALTRANMFIPESSEKIFPDGSIRTGVVNDLVATAKDDEDSVLVNVLTFALAIVTLIPSGGASLAIPAGMALAAYAAAKEWKQYDTQKTLVNTDLDLARSLSTDEPSLTGFALSLVNLGFEGAPLISVFSKAKTLKALVSAGEDTELAVRELNLIGKSRGADDLGKRALTEAKVAEKRTATDVTEAADEAAHVKKLGVGAVKQAGEIAEKEINNIGSITGGPLNDDTVMLLRKKPLLRSALAENSLAARALKKCNTPCYPDNATPYQVRTLEQHLERVKVTGKYDENMLREFLYKNRDDLDKAIGDVMSNKTARDLNGFLRDEYQIPLGKIKTLPPREDPRIRAAMVERSHNIGVMHGKTYAEKTLSLKGIGFKNPFEKFGQYGQGFDDIMVRGADLETGIIYIVEYKGGGAVLDAGQMELDWVVGNIQRLYMEGGTASELASKLSKALREGRLKGVALSTSLEGNIAKETKELGNWVYDVKKSGSKLGF
ncbi:MAG: hypothetical protein DCF32_09060 [Leptolyngbya sp.]|nr:MAG: hypothetical protein DCF32_09060 [Leptolyngbya sp.]